MRSLEHIILQNYWTYITHEKPLLTWNLLADDHPASRISVILIACDKAVGRDNKLKLLEECSKAWQRISTQGKEEVILKILDA